MKKIILLAAIILGSAQASAWHTQMKDRISTVVLGKMFCFRDNPKYGWAFLLNGIAFKTGPNLGIPGPNDYYKVIISPLEGPGHFTVQGPQGSGIFMIGIFDSDNSLTQISSELGSGFDELMVCN